MLGLFVALTMAVAGEAVKPLILIPGALASQIEVRAAILMYILRVHSVLSFE